MSLISSTLHPIKGKSLRGGGFIKQGQNSPKCTINKIRIRCRIRDGERRHFHQWHQVELKNPFKR